MNAADRESLDIARGQIHALRALVSALLIVLGRDPNTLIAMAITEAISEANANGSAASETYLRAYQQVMDEAVVMAAGSHKVRQPRPPKAP